MKHPAISFEDLIASYDEYEVLQNTRGRNDRYSYAKVRDKDKWFFLKHALAPEQIDGLERELKWANFMEFIERDLGISWLLGPKNLAMVSDNTLSMSFIDKPHLADYHSLDSWHDNLTQYAKMLHEFDMAAMKWHGDGLPDKKKRNERYYQIWCEWLGDNIGRVPRLEEARERVEQTIDQTQACMQHGDLRPWQIFNDQGNWIVYDGEASGEDLLRYNDLAYGYGRIFTNLRSPEVARQLVQEFLRVSGIDKQQFLRQFEPVMIGRAVGMVSDSFNDTPKDDYRSYAFRLLDLCLDEPQQLINNI